MRAASATPVVTTATTIKLLAFDRAVNVTLGLPIVRTGVDHGTGFDIAGKGVADPAAMIAAVGWPRGSPPCGPRRPRAADESAMPAPSSADAAGGTHLIADNRKARHDYHVFDTYAAGIVLLGTSTRAIREGRVNLKDSYGKVEGVAKGKKSCDKRETIKRRQIDRETRAMVKERSR